MPPVLLNTAGAFILAVLFPHSFSYRFGSADGGQTVHADDPELNKLMEEAGKKINIKPHMCGLGRVELQFAALSYSELTRIT